MYKPKMPFDLMPMGMQYAPAEARNERAIVASVSWIARRMSYESDEQAHQIGLLSDKLLLSTVWWMQSRHTRDPADSCPCHVITWKLFQKDLAARRLPKRYQSDQGSYCNRLEEEEEDY
jgi:hypothetical protein